MKNWMLLFFFSLRLVQVSAQPAPVEAMAGNTYVFYQHALGKSFSGNSRFGWANTASLIAWYARSEEGGAARTDEIMNQAYLTYQPVKGLWVLGGFFYTNVTQLRPSVAVKYVLHRKPWTAVLAPRVDAVSNGAFELFGMLEYHPDVGSSGWSFYSRFQFMTNHGRAGHNRSYQQFRLGVGYKSLQFGLATNLDQYGRKAATLANTGLFVRRVF